MLRDTIKLWGSCLLRLHLINVRRCNWQGSVLDECRHTIPLASINHKSARGVGHVLFFPSQCHSNCSSLPCLTFDLNICWQQHVHSACHLNTDTVTMIGKQNRSEYFFSYLDIALPMFCACFVLMNANWVPLRSQLCRYSFVCFESTPVPHLIRHLRAGLTPHPQPDMCIPFGSLMFGRNLLVLPESHHH